MLSPEVAAIFTQDARFKAETMNELRVSFEEMRKQKMVIGEKGDKLAIDAIRIYIDAKYAASASEGEGQSQAQLILLNLDEALTLTGNQSQTLSKSDFEFAMVCLEKRALFTFVESLYREEVTRVAPGKKEKVTESVDHHIENL